MVTISKGDIPWWLNKSMSKLDQMKTAIAQMKIEDAEMASQKASTKRATSNGAATKSFGCPADYDDITESADRMYNVKLDNSVIDPKYRKQFPGERFSLRVESRECRCKCHISKLCSGNMQKNTLFRSLLRAEILSKEGPISRLCGDSSSSGCIGKKWKDTV